MATLKFPRDLCILRITPCGNSPCVYIVFLQHKEKVEEI